MGTSNVRNCTRNYIIQFTAATWKLSLSLMLLLLPLALSHLDNPTDILSISCNHSSIKNGSALQGNLKGVLSSLVENVNKTGYNISWHGQNGYEVYGLAQCRGDLNASACQLCVSSATQNIVQNCSGSSSSSIHLGGCFLRYATNNFYSQIDVWDASSVSRCDDPKLINGSTDENARGVDAQIDSLLIRVVGNAVSSNVGYSTLSEEGFYTMAQCWRDLTMDQCNQCLNSLYKNLSRCPAGTSEGEALNDNCVIRYDKDKFYGDGVPLLSPASRATDEGRGRPKMLGLSIGGAVLAVMLVAIVVIWKRKFCFSKQRPSLITTTNDCRLKILTQQVVSSDTTSQQVVLDAI